MTLNSTGPTATMNVSNLAVGSITGSTLNFSLGTAGNPTAPVITTGRAHAKWQQCCQSSRQQLLHRNHHPHSKHRHRKWHRIVLDWNAPQPHSREHLRHRVERRSEYHRDRFPKVTRRGYNNTWDTSTNFPPKDWVLNSNGTTPTDYIEGDSVLFDDSSSVNNVNISNNVAPNAVTVNNSSKDYTFSGSGGITSAATLTKTGTGTLTLANDGDNNFTGTISISGSGYRSPSAWGDQRRHWRRHDRQQRQPRHESPGRTGIAQQDHRLGQPGRPRLIPSARSPATIPTTATTVETGAVLAVNSATALGSAVGNTTVQSGASLYIGAGGTSSAMPSR